MSKKLCPCGSKKAYRYCCEMFLSGKKKPETAEKLMRSRYTAYTLAKMDYIAKTMRGLAAENFDRQSAKHWAKQSQWQSLEVVSTQQTTPDEGFVEFKAYYIQKKKRLELHPWLLLYYARDQVLL